MELVRLKKVLHIRLNKISKDYGLILEHQIIDDCVNRFSFILKEKIDSMSLSILSQLYIDTTQSLGQIKKEMNYLHIQFRVCINPLCLKTYLDNYLIRVDPIILE